LKNEKLQWLVKKELESKLLLMNSLEKKIDIIEWSEDPVKFISASLSPAKVNNVEINQKKNEAKVIVPEDQLSLAIGVKGQKC